MLCGIERARLVLDLDRHVQHLEDALARRHGALQDAVLHGQRADRIEEALDVEQEGDHHAELELAVEHGHASDHDDDAHRRAGQGVDDRHHDLRQPGALQLGFQIVVDLLLEQLEVDRLAAHALNRPDTVDALGEGAVQGRAGDPCAQEGAPRARQPDDAHGDQNRHDREREQPEPPVEHQEDDRDPHQQHEVADRKDGGLEELLQGVNVALQARHEASDLGLVHEGERDALEMGVHRTAQVDQQPLRDARDQRLLEQICEEVEGHDAEEDQHAEREQPLVVRALDQRVVDHGAQDQRDRDLARGEGEDGENGQEQLTPIRADERPEPLQDPAVEGPEDLLFHIDLRADDGARRPRGLARQPRLDAGARHAHGTRSRPSSPASGCSPPRLCSAWRLA